MLAVGFHVFHLGSLFSQENICPAATYQSYGASSVCVLAVCVNQLTDKIETIKIQRGAPDCRVDERERDLQARAEYERDRAECNMIWCVNKLTLANSCVLN